MSGAGKPLTDWHKELIEQMHKVWAESYAVAPSEPTVYLTQSAMDHFKREGVDVRSHYWEQFGARVHVLEGLPG